MSIPSHGLGGTRLELHIILARRRQLPRDTLVPWLSGLLLSEATVMAVFAAQGQFHYTTFAVEGQRIVR